jgi:chitin disaccharide deacetylase
MKVHERPIPPRRAGGPALIINADDWGRDYGTTERTLSCIRCGTVSSVSAMVFMEDSERAAAIARETGIDTGLHLNLTTPFPARICPPALVQRQSEIVRYFGRHRRLGRVMFHPGLVKSFEYVVAAQLDEYLRLYGARPERIDGHHHMHLCPNVLLAGLLPPGSIVRRNHSFQPGEKGWYNRLYRRAVDGALARRHRLTDLFFSLDPFDVPGRMERIFSLAGRYVVELATHPANDKDYRFLAGAGVRRLAADISIATYYALS